MGAPQSCIVSFWRCVGDSFQILLVSGECESDSTCGQGEGKQGGSVVSQTGEIAEGQQSRDVAESIGQSYRNRHAE